MEWNTNENSFSLIRNKYGLLGIFPYRCIYNLLYKGAPPKPNWMKSLNISFTIIRMLEVAFIYFATACLAIILRLNKQLSKAGVFLYVIFPCIGAVLNILSIPTTGTFALTSYLSYIPAFSMLMPYLIAINLLAKSRNGIHT